jgi:hypothetical protein
MQMIGALEQSQRQQGGLPADFGGTSPTNVRTGKRGTDIVSAQIDFPIQESQTLLARSKEAENVIAIAMSKGYSGNKTVSFYVRKMNGVRGQVSYTPNDIFENDVNFVDYPHAGSDANQLAVLVGQLLGLELISEDTGRKLHPLIDDPFHEGELVVAESLQKQLLGAVAAQVEQGTLTAVDIAKLDLMLRQEKVATLADAVVKLHDEEQQRQAGEQPPGAPPGAGPEQMPGLAPPQPGAPAGAAVPPGGGAPPTVGPPTPSEGNLAALLSSLHGPPNQMAQAG